MSECRAGADGFYHPRNEDELVGLIARARREGRVVRVRGAAHSVLAAIFSDRFAGADPDPDGINIFLDHFRALEFDDGRMQVTAQAGCHLGRDPADPTGTSTLENSLFLQLHRRGWAVPDTGGIIHQTVGGFLGTGSSGGSLRFSVGDQIVALHLIDGRGRRQVLTAEDTPDLFRAAGVSMGLLGVVVAVTFQCVKSFSIIGQESVSTEDDCAIDLFGDGSGERPGLERFCRQTEHARLLWWPQEGVRRVVVWQGRRMTETEAGNPAFTRAQPYRQFPMVLGSSLPAQLLGGGVFWCIRCWNTPGVLGKLTRAGLRVMLAPFLKFFVRLDGKKGPQRFWDAWWRALPMDNEASDRLLPTQFTEMWIPLERSAEAMRRLRDHFRAGGLAATGPYACEVYPSRQSRFWMSPGHSGDVLKIDLFWYGRNAGNPAETFYPQFWRLLEDMDYRLHWGKHLPGDSATYLRRLFPRWDDFMRIRAELDPDQVFVSSYWRRHLGIPLKCHPGESPGLEGAPVRLWGLVPDHQCRRMVELLDRHMVTENAKDIPGILTTLVNSPRFVMEYMPFSLGNWSWFTRKRWVGRKATEDFYRGFFRHFQSLHITVRHCTLSSRGVVNSYRLEGRVLSGLLRLLGLRGIPVRLSMAAVFEYDLQEQKFVGERVYFRDRSALQQIRPGSAAE